MNNLCVFILLKMHPPLLIPLIRLTASLRFALWVPESPGRHNRCTVIYVPLPQLSLRCILLTLIDDSDVLWSFLAPFLFHTPVCDAKHCLPDLLDSCHFRSSVFSLFCLGNSVQPSETSPLRLVTARRNAIVGRTH